MKDVQGYCDNCKTTVMEDDCEWTPELDMYLCPNCRPVLLRMVMTGKIPAVEQTGYYLTEQGKATVAALGAVKP
jgi:hypothetical protein